MFRREGSGGPMDDQALRRMREAIRTRLEQEEGAEDGDEEFGDTAQLPAGGFGTEFPPHAFRDLGPQRVDQEEEGDDEHTQNLPQQVRPAPHLVQQYGGELRQPRAPRQAPRPAARRARGEMNPDRRRLIGILLTGGALSIPAIWALSRIGGKGESPVATPPPVRNEPGAPISPEEQNAASKAWVGELLTRAPQDTEAAIRSKIESGTMSLTDFAHAQAVLTSAGARRELFTWYRAHANSGISPIRGENDPEVAAFLAETNDLNKHLFAGQNKPPQEQAAWESAFVGSRMMLFNHHAKYAREHAAMHVATLGIPKASGKNTEQLAAEIAAATPAKLLAEIMARESAGGIYLGADHTVSALETTQQKQNKAQTAELVKRMAGATEQPINSGNLLAMPTGDGKIALGFSMARVEDTLRVQDEIAWAYNPVNGLEWITAMMMINYKYPGVLA